MLDHCENKDCIIKQAELLRKCIEEDKYYLSEKAGYDVGWDFAQQHFIKTYFAGFAVVWRAVYCSQACPLRSGCYIATKYL
jgi:hypothetical protein